MKEVRGLYPYADFKGRFLTSGWKSALQIVISYISGEKSHIQIGKFDEAKNDALFLTRFFSEGTSINDMGLTAWKLFLLGFKKLGLLSAVPEKKVSKLFMVL